MDRNFLTLDAEHREQHTVKDPNELKRGETYSQGNWTSFKKALDRFCEKENARVLYIGDSITDDVYVPTKYANLDTIAIIEEIDEITRPELGGNLLGSMFQASKEGPNSTKASLFFSMAANNAKLAVRSVDELIKLPLDSDAERVTCFSNESPLTAGFFPPECTPAVVGSLTR